MQRSEPVPIVRRWPRLTIAESNNSMVRIILIRVTELVVVGV